MVRSAGKSRLLIGPYLNTAPADHTGYISSQIPRTNRAPSLSSALLRAGAVAAGGVTVGCLGAMQEWFEDNCTGDAITDGPAAATGAGRRPGYEAGRGTRPRRRRVAPRARTRVAGRHLRPDGRHQSGTRRRHGLRRAQQPAWHARPPAECRPGGRRRHRLRPGWYRLGIAVRPRRVGRQRPVADRHRRRRSLGDAGRRTGGGLRRRLDPPAPRRRPGDRGGPLDGRRLRVAGQDARNRRRPPPRGHPRPLRALTLDGEAV